MTELLDAPELGSGPGTYPVPAGRGRWRLTLHRRQFTAAAAQSTLLGELPRARSRKVVQAWNTPAVLTFDIDGQAPEAQLFTELQHDVIAWRWDDTTGVDRPVFRGVINASEDQLDEQSHVVTVTCTDYLLALTRRFLWTTWSTPGYPAGGEDQDALVSDLVNLAIFNAQTTSGNVFGAGAYAPLSVQPVHGDGSYRSAPSGNVVIRTYFGNQVIFDAFDQLAKCQGGFDYDVLPYGGLPMGSQPGADWLRIFYAGPSGPQQGQVRTNPVLAYASSVVKVQRQLTSADYGNYWRELGNNQNAIADAPQIIGEAWNADSFNSVVGLWASPDNAADVVDPATAAARARGNLNRYGVLIPVYTLTLRPGFYYAGLFNMGDTLPLVIMHGRLSVNTTVRVLGITYDIGDDGQEDVTLTVGRPDTTLVDVLGGVAADVDALARR
jgi:hypothetical protein